MPYGFRKTEASDECAYTPSHMDIEQKQEAHMAKAIRAIVGTETININKVYFVDSGMAKKISKVYAVVDGKTKLVFPPTPENIDEPIVYDGALAYDGTAMPLPLPTDRLMGASSEGYAIFAGGREKKTSTSYSSVQAVTAYDKNLTQSAPEELSDARYGGHGLRFKGEAVFAGGYSKTSATRRLLIESYDSSLTRKSLPNFSATKEHASGLSPAATEKHMAFPQYEDSEAAAEIYDESFTKLDNIVLGWPKRTKVSASSVSGHLIFGGGANSVASSLYSDCKTYDGNLTLINDTHNLSLARAVMGTAGTVGHAFFAGNANTGTSTEYGTCVDVFDGSLTLKSVAPLTHPYCQEADNDIAVLNGNMVRANVVKGSIDKYDASLTKETSEASGIPSYSACAAVGNFMLIAGGTISSSPSNAVHKIRISKR